MASHGNSALAQANGCTLDNLVDFPGRAVVQDVLDAAFFGACDRHDLCYRDCSGPLASGFEGHRESCDNQFLLEMQIWCGAASGFQAITDLGLDPVAFEAGCASGMFGVYLALRGVGEGNYIKDQCQQLDGPKDYGCHSLNNACCYYNQGPPGCPLLVRPCDPDGTKEAACSASGGFFEDTICLCLHGGSPIILNLEDSKIRLTDAATGVDFDINGDGKTERISWTASDSTDAFLVLDRNGNGEIDNGTELFGNFTIQPPSDSRNGFLALATFDLPALGGDANGRITVADGIFDRLKLWTDSNHDGISQAGELASLSSFGIVSIGLDFKESGKQDRYGNEFRYRSRVYFVNNKKSFAYDVFLIM